MPLRPDEIAQVEEIARQVVKEEIDVMKKSFLMKLREIHKDLDARITNLKMEIKEFETKINSKTEKIVTSNYKRK